MPVEGGAPVKVFDVPRSFTFRDGIRWASSGTAVCYLDWNSGIWKQDIEGGAPQRLAGLTEEEIVTYGWSRDGKSFAFSRARSARDVVLIKISSRDQKARR